LLFFLLKCYEELPLTTAALVLVLRVLQRRWSRASRQVVEIGVYPRSSIPFVCRTTLTIPVVLLLVPFHVRRLESPRLDSSPLAPFWHGSTGNRQSLCVGCLRPLKRFNPQFCCHFCDTGFSLDDKQIFPSLLLKLPSCLPLYWPPFPVPSSGN
jgi:hypothetical protein